MTEGPVDYEKVINYYGRGEGATGTAHVVAEERETEVDTACGRTLRKKTSGGITGFKGGYVYEFGAVPRSAECGNCPWDAVEEARDDD